MNLTVFDAMGDEAVLEIVFRLSRPGRPAIGGFQVVNDDNDLVLTLMKGKDRGRDYPLTFHIGFIQP